MKRNATKGVKISLIYQNDHTNQPIMIKEFFGTHVLINLESGNFWRLISKQQF